VTIRLTDRDRQMLDGRCGEGPRLAMAIIVRMAGVCGAGELMDVTQAHIDGCGLLSDAGLEFAETLAARGARVAIPTTLNMGPLDLQNWKVFGVREDFAAKAIRQAKAYTDMGCIPTWTCAPYQGYLAPRFGQQIAWGESNAVVYANSVLGARTQRYGDYMDICAAITGRVPRQGLHLRENRRGQLLVRLAGFDAARLGEETFWPAFGHFLGAAAGDRIPVIEGLPAGATDDQLKALGAAAASSGAVALFHAVGLTPEAPTLEEAFQGARPEEVLEVRPADIEGAAADLSTASDGAGLDVVLLGCPHFSFAEFRRLAGLVRRVGGRSRVEFIVITSAQSHALVLRSDLVAPLADFGVRITLDTCMFHTPMVAPGTRVLMTNSGKCAYYAPGELGVQVAFGSLADCVRSAVEGRVCRASPGQGRASPRRSRAAPRAKPGGPPMTWRLTGQVLVAGSAEGRALVSPEPLSFWGGFNPKTGEIVDRRHALSGHLITGRALVLPAGKGSSTSSACLLESIRAGTAPAAILLLKADPILALGAIVADELYGRSVPILVLPEEEFRSLKDGDRVAVGRDGRLTVRCPDAG